MANRECSVFMKLAVLSVFVVTMTGGCNSAGSEASSHGGTTTATDVRDAESALAEARADEAQTLMDYWIARAALARAG